MSKKEAEPRFYLVYEYEIYKYDYPKHAWYLVDIFDNKREAGKRALEYNFDEFCKNKPFRWSKSMPTKIKNLTQEDKRKIVETVLDDIRKRTGALNDYFGKGAFILSSDEFQFEKGDDEHIEDISKHLAPKALERYKEMIRQRKEEEEEDSEDESTEEYSDEDDTETEMDSNPTPKQNPNPKPNSNSNPKVPLSPKPNTKQKKAPPQDGYVSEDA